MKNVKAIKSLKAIINKLGKLDKKTDYVEIQSLFCKGAGIVQDVDDDFVNTVMNSKEMDLDDDDEADVNTDCPWDAFDLECYDNFINWSRDLLPSVNSDEDRLIDLPSDASVHAKRINRLFNGNFYCTDLDTVLDPKVAVKPLENALYRIERFDPDDLSLYPFYNVAIPDSFREKQALRERKHYEAKQNN